MSLFIARMIMMLLLLVGVGLLWWVSNEYRLAKQSSEWATVEGTITESRRSHSPRGQGMRSGGTSWKGKYRYVIDGAVYENWKPAFGWVLHGEDVKDLLGRFQKGNPVEIYYNPKKPSQSVLEQGFNKSYWRFTWFLIPLGLFFVAGGTAGLFLPTSACSFTNKNL